MTAFCTIKDLAHRDCTLAFVPTPTPCHTGYPARPAAAASAAAMSIQPVLEPLPKWELLREVMGEVQAERAALLEARAEAAAAQQEAQQEGEAAECGAAARGAGDAMPVLVVCQDAFTASQVRLGPPARPVCHPWLHSCSQLCI